MVVVWSVSVVAVVVASVGAVVGFVVVGMVAHWNRKELVFLHTKRRSKRFWIFQRVEIRYIFSIAGERRHCCS